MSAKNSDRAKQHRTLPSLEKNSEGYGNNVNGRAMCKSRQSVKPTSTSSAMHSKKHSAASNDDQVINVNLTDPDDLLQKLENMSLTEEEENEILQQALEVNQALKRKLHHQQQKQRKPCSSSSESMRASAAAYGDHQRNPRSGPLMAQKPGNSGRKLSPLHTGSRQSSQIPKSSTNHRKVCSY